MLHPLAASNGGSALGLLFPVLLIAAFFFLLVRPQRQRQRQAQQVQAALSLGVEVMTTSGIFGTVAGIADDMVTVEVSPGVHVRFLRGAIARVVPPATDVPVELPPDDQPRT